MYGQKFLRGQIWWVGTKKPLDGSVQSSNRPHLIVGNNIGNRNSPIILVVPCTTEDKKQMTTHVEFEMNGKNNTILCEQIKTINADELLSYMFTLDDEIIEKVNKSLRISLGLENDINKVIQKEEMNKELIIVQPSNVSNSIESANKKEIVRNKRGRVWSIQDKKDFVDCFERNGENYTMLAYNTGSNTKQYYKRFKITLKMEENNEKGCKVM